MTGNHQKCDMCQVIYGDYPDSHDYPQPVNLNHESKHVCEECLPRIIPSEFPRDEEYECGFAIKIGSMYRIVTGSLSIVTLMNLIRNEAESLNDYGQTLVTTESDVKDDNKGDGSSDDDDVKRENSRYSAHHGKTYCAFFISVGYTDGTHRPKNAKEIEQLIESFLKVSAFHECSSYLYDRLALLTESPIVSDDMARPFVKKMTEKIFFPYLHEFCAYRGYDVSYDAGFTLEYLVSFKCQEIENVDDEIRQLRDKLAKCEDKRRRLIWTDEVKEIASCLYTFAHFPKDITRLILGLSHSYTLYLSHQEVTSGIKRISLSDARIATASSRDTDARNATASSRDTDTVHTRIEASKKRKLN